MDVKLLPTVPSYEGNISDKNAKYLSCINCYGLLNVDVSKSKIRDGSRRKIVVIEIRCSYYGCDFFKI